LALAWYALVAKTSSGYCFVLTFAATWFARQNHFEWMFNPLAERGLCEDHRCRLHD
jgi:hypothetical protein